MYVGTAAGFGVLHPVFAQGFMTGIGSRSMYSSSTQDCANKFAVAREMYGFPFTQPFPDLERTGCLIVVGANPVISKWSFLQVPNPARTLQEIQARGGADLRRRPAAHRDNAAPPASTSSSAPTPTSSSTCPSCTSSSPPAAWTRSATRRFTRGLDEVTELAGPGRPSAPPR